VDHERGGRERPWRTLRRLERQIYDTKRQKLEALINERLLAREAATRGVTVDALLEAEVTAKGGP
jgi:hypothetical protein